MMRYGMVLVIFFFITLSIGETVNDQVIGYTLPLPKNWIRIQKSSQHHIFMDTSGTYSSQCAIVRYDFSTATTYSTADEWTRANFIAYQFSVEADPLCVLSFFDTITVKQNGQHWAADAYTYFFDPDTAIGEWAEYIRFTAVGTSGYELYALGPIDDMDANVQIYAQIISNLQLNANSYVESRVSVIPTIYSVKRSGSEHFDLLGRTVIKKSSLPTQLLLQSNNRKLLLLYR